MNRVLLISILTLLPAAVYAAPVNHPLGSNLTTGSISMPHSLMSYTNNPATGASLLETDGGGFGMSVPFSSVGVGLELGPIENLYNQFSVIETKLTSMQASFANIGTGTLPDLAAVRDLEAEMQTFIKEANQSFYLDLNLGADVPMTPFVITTKRLGSLGFDVNAMVQAKIQVLDSPLDLDFLAQGDQMISTNTSGYIKAGAVLESALFYSREALRTEKGTLYGGARVKMYQVLLSKSLVPFSEMDSAMDLVTQQLEDVTNDGAQMGFGLDLGALWTTPRYQAGATITNINAPSFKYPTIGKNCGTNDSCYVAASFSNRIAVEEKYVMVPQLTIDGAYYNTAKTWVLGGSLDLNPSPDPVGNEYQWFVVSGSYTPRMWSKWFWVPAMRIGYRHNLAGTEMNYITTGLGWLGLNLDLAYGLTAFDTSKIADLKDIPFPIGRSVYLNLGISYMF